MVGAVLIVIVLVVVLPMLILIGGAVVGALLGWSARATAEHDHEGSELTELNT